MADPTQNDDVDDDLVLDPPVATRVAKRALVLAAVGCRGDMESTAPSEPFRHKILQWIDANDLRDELEPEEQELLATPVGQLQRQDAIDATWRAEGMGVLAWALRFIELPAHDHQVHPGEVAESLGFMAERPPALHSPQLRSPDEIGWLVEFTFAIHWRLRQFSLDRRPIDFTKVAAEAWIGPLNVEGLEFAESDLAIDGVPIARSPRWEQVLSIAAERHQAANWLAGEDPVYSEVPTDT